MQKNGRCKKKKKKRKKEWGRQGRMGGFETDGHVMSNISQTTSALIKAFTSTSIDTGFHSVVFFILTVAKQNRPE